MLFFILRNNLLNEKCVLASSNYNPHSFRRSYHFSSIHLFNVSMLHLSNSTKYLQPKSALFDVLYLT